MRPIVVTGLMALLGTAGAGAALANDPPPPPGVGTQGARTLAATLDTRQEVPRPKGPTTGKGTFRANGSFTCEAEETNCDRKPGRLTWSLTFRSLTGPATAAHIHVGKPGKTGTVLVPLCTPCSATAKGSFRVTRAVMNAILDRGAYVNVHTKRNPAGEIRGTVFVSAVL